MMSDKLVEWKPVSNLKPIKTTEKTIQTNDRNIRACYPTESEEEIQNRIYKNLKSNPEYNR